MVQWTKEQEEAIYTSGSNILVAAAAGSGKTAVLVERIIQKLLSKDDPVDIDSLLVVTFTNAAAQEMRTRVGLALEKALAADPGSIHLKKQLSLLQRASISTLHSFCLDVIRQYAYLLDIDPGFRIANDMEIDLIKQDVLDELFEEWYGLEEEEQEAFFAVVESFSNDRSDVDVEKLILDLYTFSVQNPWPEKWLDDLAAVYNIAEDWKEEELSFIQMLKSEVKSKFQALREEMETAMEIARESDGPYQYIETIEADLLGLQEAERSMEDWEKLHEFMRDYKFVRLSSKKMECNEDKREAVKKLRNSYKDSWTKGMKEQWFTRSLDRHIEDMRLLYPVVKKLTELVKAFKDRFTEIKREKAIVDFSDLEHYCLQLLLDADGKVETVPSSVALHFQDKFSEVLVDEYQDSATRC